MTAVDRCSDKTRTWVCEAVRIIEADANRSADTHLIPFPLPPEWNVGLYLKDESTHPTGSLKHRLARSLFLYALCNGWIVERHPGDRGVVGLDGRVGGVLRPHARPAVHRGDAAHDVGGEGRADRAPGRPVPLRRRAEPALRRVAPPRGRARRPLHGPVHPRRAGHGLARQQQHRRVDLLADVAGAAPRAGVGRRRRGHRRHQRDDRPLHPLPAAAHPAGRGGPGALGLLRGVARRRARHDRRAGARGSRASAARASSRRSSARSSTA